MSANQKLFSGKTVLLGVTGSIAAYKIASLASALKKQDADVHVLMTKNATNLLIRSLSSLLQEINAWWIPLIVIFSFR